MAAEFTQPLWPAAAPDAIASGPADVPTLSFSSPAHPDGSAVIVCPGGGYTFHAEYEAEPVARWLAALGVTGIVLRYRVAPRYRHPIPFLDVSRAIRQVRANAPQTGLDPQRMAVMGFSAGGHLAAHLSTRFDPGNAAAHDPVERVSSRPDAAVLLYPVITFTELSHHTTTTTRNLLGDSPSREAIEQLSCERHVTRDTPPTFIYHASGDSNVPVINSMLYADALRRNGVPFEMHLYDRVAHGVGLAATDAYLRTWPALCAAWLASKGFGRGIT